MKYAFCGNYPTEKKDEFVMNVEADELPRIGERVVLSSIELGTCWYKVVDVSHHLANPTFVFPSGQKEVVKTINVLVKAIFEKTGSFPKSKQQ